MKGTTQGTITDADGKYALTAEDTTAVLVFSFVGYLTKEVPLGKRTLIDVQLSVDQQQLKEVVVMGYGVQDKNLISGSVLSIKMNDDRRNTPTTSLANLLAGTMAGLNVGTANGIPGTLPAASIRTSSSWNAQNILLVIDGKISEMGDFAILSPNDVDNVSVLKDAAAAAAYGARAAGGVIVITTRRGSKGSKPKITYSFSSGFDVRGKNAPLTSAIQCGEIYNRLNPASNTPWTQADTDYFKNINGGWGYNQLDAVLARPSTSVHNLSVSGGGDKITYFIGGSYTKQGGLIKNLTYDKYNFRANLTADITKNLNLFTGISVGNNLTYGPPNTVVGDVTGIYRKLLVWQPWQPVFTDGGNPMDYGWIGNVGSEVRGDGGYESSNGLTPTINLKAIYTIPAVPGLSASVQYNKAYANKRSKKFLKRYDLWMMKTTGSYQISTKDADFVATKKSSQIGKDYIEETYEWSNNYQVDFQLNYERTFADKHHLKGWVVYEQAEANDGGATAGRETFPVYTTDQWWAASADRINDYGSGKTVNTSGRKSWVGQAFYDYEAKYLVALTGRYDASAKFPKDKRWGFFPSASLGWIASQEDFFKNVKAIDYLKFRTSLGFTSADNIDSWQWQQSYKSEGSAYFGTNGATNAGVIYGALPNPNITWEKTMNYNAAFDLNFLEHFNTTVEYYYVRTYDILGARVASVPPTFPLTLPSSNYGEVRVHGIDFTLGYKNHIGEFAYTANINMNYGAPKDIIVDQTITYPYEKKPGNSRTIMVNRVATGMIRTQADLDAFKMANPNYTYYGIAPALGQLTYEDISGAQGVPDGKIDDWDKKIIFKNNNPVNMGVNLGASWKGVTLSASFAGKLHQKTAVQGLAGGVEWNRMWTKWYTDSWTPENTNASLPKRYGANDGASRVTNDESSFWIKNSDFLRLRTLSLAYSLPDVILKKIKISECKVYFSGTNLFLFSSFNKLYYDPEVGNNFPLMKNFNFGISVTL